ncbi:MAG: 4-alpha-glucanotransferase, partial [Streptococcus sp.]
MNIRASGVLMHITSLPGDYGIGSFGQAAYDFVDFLKETKQTYWQILPLTTTSYGDSPYQSFSAIAGNTHFIDLDFLIRDGFLTEADVEGSDFGSDPEFIDYAKVYEARRPLLEKAVKAILADENEAKKFETFKAENANWLADYADFMAIKEYFGNKALQDWDDKKVIKRDEATLEKLRKELTGVITYHQVVQYLFFSQWAELKSYANKNGIQIIGDMPIYVSADSVEVWTQPHLFTLDAECKPRY